MTLINDHPVATAWICGCFFDMAIQLGAVQGHLPWLLLCPVMFVGYYKAYRWQTNMRTLYFALTDDKPDGYAEQAVIKYFEKREER